MTSSRRLVLVLAVAVGGWVTWRRLRFDTPLSAREWRDDTIGPDDLAG